MDLKRILVAINSPNGRDAAFERALALARSSGAELYLLHAVPVNQRFSFRAAERLERMVDMRKRAEDAGVRVQTVEQHGDPAEIIELHANARAVDLIVMGGEARLGWAAAIGRWSPKGLFAGQMFRLWSLRVTPLTVRPPSETCWWRLICHRLRRMSSRAAIGLTAGEAVQLTVMHTVKGIEAADAVQSPARWMVPEYRTHVLEDARRTLEAVVSAVPAGVDTRVQVSTGSAARTILEHAADADADLVVVGRSRGFKMLGFDGSARPSQE